MTKPIAPDVIYHLTTVASPTLSPDGTQLAYVRSQVDQAAMEVRSQLMLGRVGDGEARPFTAGQKDTLPRFSPDGATLAFLRQDEQELRQLWLIPMAGGEGRQLTQEPGAVTEYAWSPDSKAIAFISDVDPDRLPDDHDTQKDPRVRVVRRIRYRADTLGWRGEAHRHLFVADIVSGETRQLTDGDGDESGSVWSPDGGSIAFVSDWRGDRDIVPFTDAYVVLGSSGDLTCWSEGLVSVAGVAWSPDGNRLVAIGSQDPSLVPGWQGWLYVLEPGQPPLRLTDDTVNPAGGFAPILPPLELRWTAAGQVLFVGERHGQSHLWAVPADGGELVAVTGGNALFSGVAFDAEARWAVVVSTSPDSAGDLELVDLSDGSRRRLTHQNQEYLSEHPPARQEKFTFDRDGYQVECRLLLPHSHDPARQYPMVLDIHGGPHGVFADTFNLTQQVLATAGYIVLAVNPRGSSTYGADFAKAVLRDWGGEDYRDIMAAVGHATARPDVDASRLGVHGYSYGGYMSSWIVGHERRFLAAVAGAPCTDLPALYGTSDIGVGFGEVQWGGMRQQAEAAWRERSPITYATQVQTPMLLLHGETDHRVPIEQSEAYFVALKRLGREVELVRFPDCAHSFLRGGHPRMREEYLARTLGWFDRWLGRPD